jgi:competence protein ComGC
MTMKTKSNHQAGSGVVFTLIEMLAIIAIISLEWLIERMGQETREQKMGARSANG